MLCLLSFVTQPKDAEHITILHHIRYAAWKITLECNLLTSYHLQLRRRGGVVALGKGSLLAGVRVLITVTPVKTKKQEVG